MSIARMSSSTVRSATSAAVNRAVASRKSAPSPGLTRPSKPIGWPVVRSKIGWKTGSERALAGDLVDGLGELRRRASVIRHAVALGIVDLDVGAAVPLRPVQRRIGVAEKASTILARRAERRRPRPRRRRSGRWWLPPRAPMRARAGSRRERRRHRRGEGSARTRRHRSRNARSVARLAPTSSRPMEARS